jgi:hypothetical protein
MRSLSGRWTAGLGARSAAAALAAAAVTGLAARPAWGQHVAQTVAALRPAASPLPAEAHHALGRAAGREAVKRTRGARIQHDAAIGAGVGRWWRALSRQPC